MKHWSLVIYLALCIGCSTHYEAVPTNHIIMVNTEGHPVDPTGNIFCEQTDDSRCDGGHSTAIEYPSLTNSQYLNYINRLATNLQNGQPCGINSQGTSYLDQMKAKGIPPKLLIFIHGGLNTQTGSVQRAVELCKSITAAGYYPIFLNWQSALSPSYWNHLAHIRQGEDWRGGAFSKIGGYITAPVQLFGDLTRAIVRAPIATFLQVRNDIETVPPFRPMLSLWSSDLALAQESAFTALCQRARGNNSPHSLDALKEYATLLGKPYDHCTTHGIEPEHELAGFKLSLGIDQRDGLEKNWAFAKYFITLPTKLVSAPIIDAAGTSAWDIMLRSVSQLFHFDAEQHTHNNLDHPHSIPTNTRNYKSRGALHLFFKTLEEKLCNRAPAEKRKGCSNNEHWEITLVAHSAGTIIAHHILREFEDLPIKNIVYMGAASSIRDYQETTFPYLALKNKPFITSPNDPDLEKKEPTRIYHLMLHEAAESGEWFWDTIDPFPRGSLLIWLDNFLSHPLSKEDRTLGRFTNFITSAHHTPHELRPFIHIQKFGVGNEVHAPKKHGDFGDKFKFWDARCWESWPANSDCYSEEGYY